MKIETATRKAYIFASRIKPGIKSDALEVDLCPLFPEMHYEELTAKIPELILPLKRQLTYVLKLSSTYRC